MSKLVETRAEFQHLADERLEEAKALLLAERWSGAYYLAGYAVELALKSCIIKSLMATDAFPDKEFSKRCYTHSIGDLVDLAKLTGDLKVERDANSKFAENWQVTLGWSEVKRYHAINQAESKELCSAIADTEHGVLLWIKSRW